MKRLLPVFPLLCLAAAAQLTSAVSPHRYVTRSYHADAPAPSAVSIPTWTGTTAGFTYRMVGQDPTAPLGSPATTVPVTVVPLALTFSDGSTFDASVADPACSSQGSALSLLLSSPIFNNFSYSPGGTAVGNTQYEDFFQRANFWNYTKPSGTNPNYHVLLSPAAVAVVKVAVPAAKGSTKAAGCGRLGEVEINWLDNYLVTTVFPSLGVTAANMVVFQLYNVAAYDTTTSTCCILGYHSAFDNASRAVQTYAVADFDTTGDFGSTRDVSPLSHELGEWLDDPLGNNPTPAWGNVGQVTGCQADLEVGDPLSGTNMTVTMSNAYAYHVQELAFLSWFYRQSPSIGVNGWYSSNDTFTKAAPPCASTSTDLTVSPSTIAAGASTTVTIAVHAAGATAASSGAAGTPTGMVALIPSTTGTALDTFTLTNGSVSAMVANLPSGSYTLTAHYAGDSTFSPSDSGTVKVDVGTSIITLNPVALSFGSENVGTAASAKSVTLTNNGAAPLSGISISLAGASPGDYSQTNNCPASLVGAASCSISVIFKPTAAGLRTASVNIADNASGAPQTVPLSGTGATSGGTGALALSPASLTFTAQNLGTTSAAQTVTLTNNGTAALTIHSLSFGGQDPRDFTGSTNCFHSLAVGASCTATIAFQPTATGSRTAALIISDNAAGSPQSVTLTGMGANAGTPAIMLSAASLTFASQAVGAVSAAQTVTLTNSGSGALTVSSIDLTGANASDFIVLSDCHGILAASASCRLTVSFRPKAIGSRTSSISIADNAAGSPQAIGLTGTGTASTGHGGHSFR